jgi:small GTP-binding protein
VGGSLKTDNNEVGEGSLWYSIHLKMTLKMKGIRPFGDTARMSCMNSVWSNTHHPFKVVVIGDCYTGKTSLLRALKYERFDEEAIASTIGVDFVARVFKIKNKEIKLQIWDTAGQERFRSIITTFLRASKGVILSYDISRRDSFDSVPHWIDLIEDYCEPDVPIVMIGTMADKHFQRQVSRAEADKFAERHPQIISHMLISSKQMKNVQLPFKILAEELIRKRIEENVKLEDELKNRKVVRLGRQFENFSGRHKCSFASCVN